MKVEITVDQIKLIHEGLRLATQLRMYPSQAVVIDQALSALEEVVNEMVANSNLEQPRQPPHSDFLEVD